MRRFQVEISPIHCNGCTFCVSACPKDCLVMSDKFSPRGYLLPVFKNPEACTGCGFCVVMCPDFAVQVFKVTEE